METQTESCSYCHGPIDVWGRGCCERMGSWPSWVVTVDAVKLRMGMEWDGVVAVWMRRVCSHSRQCGLVAKVSGRQGLGGATRGAAQQQEYGRSPLLPNQSSHTRGYWKRPSAILCFGAPSHL